MTARHIFFFFNLPKVLVWNLLTCLSTAMENMAEIEISQLFLLPIPCSLSSTGERIICMMMKDFQKIMRLEKLIQLWGSQMCAFPGGALSLPVLCQRRIL